MSDTSPEVQQLYESMLMSLSGEERMLRGALMFEAAKEMALASFPKNLDSRELRSRLYERIYGEPLPRDFFEYEANSKKLAKRL